MRGNNTKVVLNCPEPDNASNFDEDEYPTTDVDVEPITEAEAMNAIQKLKNGKSAGVIQIQTELLKHSLNTSPAVIPELTKLCNDIWYNRKYFKHRIHNCTL